MRRNRYRDNPAYRDAQIRRDSARRARLEGDPLYKRLRYVQKRMSANRARIAAHESGIWQRRAAIQEIEREQVALAHERVKLERSWARRTG